MGEDDVLLDSFYSILAGIRSGRLRHMSRRALRRRRPRRLGLHWFTVEGNGLYNRPHRVRLAVLEIDAPSLTQMSWTLRGIVTRVEGIDPFMAETILAMKLEVLLSPSGKSGEGWHWDAHPFGHQTIGESLKLARELA